MVDLNMVDKAYDTYTTRCPMLGHLVPFKYCREANNGHLCPRIFDCWHEHFDIISFIDTNYSGEQLDTLLKPSESKLSQILGLVEKAKKAKS